MKIYDLVLPLLLAAYPQNSGAHTKPHKLNKITVDGEIVHCNYVSGGTNIWGKIGPDKMAAYLSDNDSDGKLDSVTEARDDVDYKYWAEKHFLPSDTEEERKMHLDKMKEWQPEFERYLAMFAPKCETK